MHSIFSSNYWQLYDLIFLPHFHLPLLLLSRTFHLFIGYIVLYGLSICYISIPILYYIAQFYLDLKFVQNRGEHFIHFQDVLIQIRKIGMYISHSVVISRLYYLPISRGELYLHDITIKPRRLNHLPIN